MKTELSHGCRFQSHTKNKYIVYGTFEVEVEANSEEEAKSQFDIGDADVTVQGCYRSDDEGESEET